MKFLMHHRENSRCCFGTTSSTHPSTFSLFKALLMSSTTKACVYRQACWVFRLGYAIMLNIPKFYLGAVLYAILNWILYVRN